MILFIFEGEDREPHIYKTLERLYFPKKNDNIICSFGNNIYELYRQMMEYGEDADIVGLMKEMLELFNDETDHGKLYINYPMIESLRYTKVSMQRGAAVQVEITRMGRAHGDD